MARDFNGTTDVGTTNGQVDLTAYKAFARAFWIKFDTSPSNAVPISDLNRTGVGSSYASISAAEIDVYFYTSAGFHSAHTSAVTINPGTWYLIAYNIDSTQTASYFVRNIWLGALGGANPVDYIIVSTGDLTATFGRKDTVRFGLPGTNTNGANAAIERLGTWGAASGSILSQADVNALFAGTDPTTIEPGSLQHYWPFLGNANPEPDSAASPITVAVTGTTQASGPFAAGGSHKFSVENLGLCPLSPLAGTH